MVVTISAAPISAGSPAPIQVVLQGVPSGAAYVVRGSALGSSWTIPGGEGVGDGGQIVLVDNRSAINTPTVYSALVEGVTYTAPPVTVDLPGTRIVLQSLDGATSVVPEPGDLRANGLPRSYVVRSHASQVPGRRRPPARYAPGGDGGGSLVLRTSRAATAHLEAILAAGSPVVVRTDGSVRDMVAVDIIRITDASSVLWDALDTATGGMSDGRVWSLGYVLCDDPEPSTPLAAFTWDDFDAAWAEETWDDFDAFFAGLTWDDFDTTDWDQLP